MSNRSPDDLTCSEVKQRNPIGMDYRADHAEHKFPGSPSASFSRRKMGRALGLPMKVSTIRPTRNPKAAVADLILPQERRLISETAGPSAVVRTLDRGAATQV